MRASLPHMILLASCWGAIAAAAGEAGFRLFPLPVPHSGRTGFTLMPPSATGIRFTNRLADVSVTENQIRLIGSGVALGDVDGDGRCDIYVCGLERPNALYRNLGNWQFEDITERAGVGCPGQYSTGCVLADLDGDGDLDLLVNSIGGGTRCFLNDGKGHFTESNSGLVRKFCATSMALADIDGDGTLDLYVANYRVSTIRSTGLQMLVGNGRRMLRPEDRESYEITPQGRILEHGEPDVVYLNDGHSNFTVFPWGGGNFIDADGQPLTRGDKDWGLGVMLRDLNGDGAPDIYVCNDFMSPDAIWINYGHGRFRALPKLALRKTSTFSMGIDFADINRDGLDDFIVLDMRSRQHLRRMTQRSTLDGTPTLPRIDERPQTERNTLFLNRGDGTFAEIAQLAGLQASEWSWCPVFLDVDLDGYEDLLVTTGHGFDTQDVDAEEAIAHAPRSPYEKFGDHILRYPPLHVPSQAFRNRGDLTFEPTGDTWGFNAVGVSHGMALADLDGDGDLDVVVNNLNGGLALYRNESAAPRLAVRLEGKAPNTRGIGAKIVVLGGPVPQSQEMICGGRYLSSDDTERVFAAWNVTNRFTVTVRWRNGTVSTVSNVPANVLCEVDEAGAVPGPNVTAPTAKPPLFRDVSDGIAHQHHDPPFDDFARQPLLSRRLSHGGPGVAWVDLDGDGREDLIISEGRGGRLVPLYNRGGKFEPGNPLPGTGGDDQTTVVGWPGRLIVGTAIYEKADPAAGAAEHFELQGGEFKRRQLLPPQLSATGPLALADVDADGQLDLFVGGQVNAARYPEPATSVLFRNDNGVLIPAAKFAEVGLVNGAVFTDLDGDGFPELVLACEWGPLKIFRNDHGEFSPWDPPISGAALTPQVSTLSQLRGWWQGVTAGDFDGDGRMDLVASNWGRNSPYQTFLHDEIRIYYGDFGGSREIDGVEAYIENGRLLPWRDLHTLSRAMPWLRKTFPTCRSFAKATLNEVLGEHMAQAKELRVNWVDSAVFLNRGDHFEVRSLPIEAQFAPGFGVCVADFDGDGNEDIFLAQNFSETEGETSRYDAGRGLILRGDGRGGFAPIPGQESGVLIYGDQRGAAVCDFDGDGRVDIAVGQNSAEVKLLHNETARPGLCVRLRGPAGNPSGIGAVLRRGRGPAREIHAGAGYWSQDSSTVVLAGPGNSLWVRWPGGKEAAFQIPAGAASLTVNFAGTISVP